ncbi:T9SS type A sorting domain-containing protein [Dyadobacter sp. CY323]|uniref:T9SS type A sorting domain-containing protein n=1 Tax=Dyadobacter sp. CY323 TaxID=2907302 RepID=UPI001F33713E|nr:T9SS type A sorting domain-containing protein [Dyadobacter sp. CY323]MCE6990306.1 T9SS type A sorting domain-containing protein [Dyadobacter sp. CY323]
MNFLRKIVFTGLMASPFFAAAHEGSSSIPLSSDSVNVEAGLVADLNHTYTIKNPYADSPDKPFTITPKTVAASPAPLASKVTCGGRTWEHNQYLGSTSDGKEVRVRLQDNRIYLNWDGEVSANIWILYYLNTGAFQDNSTDGPTIANCVNPVDPSTARNQLLGRTNDGQITCKGIVMPDRDFLGTYVGSEGNTYQSIRYVNGMLRVAMKQGENDTRDDFYDMGLLKFTIRHANTHSKLSAKWEGVLTEEMVDGCFWPIVPKAATPVAETPCASGPTLKTVTNVNQTSLRFTYEGTGVTSIKWKILSGSNTVASNATGTLSGTTVNLSYGSLTPGSYKLVIEGNNCVSGSSEMNFTVPVPPVGACIAGPNVGAVTNISATGLRFSFDGLGVNTIKWKILSGSSTVASGTTPQLTSSQVNIIFGSLSPGNYKLAIEGGDCNSSLSETTFTVPGSISNCASGPTLKTVTNVNQTSLRFTYEGTGVTTIKWKILSGANTVANNTTGNLSSTTVDLSFGSLSPGNYKLAIEGGNCVSGQSELNFTVPAPPVGNCIAGPNLGAITNISATGLQFGFDGLGVHTIKWKILSGANTVASGTTPELTSANVNLIFSSLTPGNYKLAIEGGDCTSSVSEKPFTVPGSTPNCSAGPTLKTVTNITPTSLRFTYEGTGVSTIKWKILSGLNTVETKTTGNLSTTTVNVTFGTLSPGNYKLSIEGGNCVSGQSELSFTVPVPPVPDCIGGPSISTIKNISQTGLTVDFAGTNLQIFSWKILQNTSEVGSGKTTYLSTKSTAITFPTLAAGTYTLQIIPEDCKGTPATKTFVVPVAQLTPCVFGPELLSLKDPSPTALKFQFNGIQVTAINWKIMKGNTMMRSSSVEPKSSLPEITYDRLNDGEYTLEIQGGNCKSAVASSTFKVSGSLPIYIANFKGEVVDKGVELSWEVVAEQDGKEFEVLRYDDKLKKEEVLGKVSLTDQRIGWYHFVDEKPLLGINYYQLKQIDINGTFEKSKMISINPGIITGRVVAPNPAQDYVDIQFTSRTAGLSTVSIYSVSGVEVSSSQIQIKEGNNNHRLNVKKLIGGSYIIKIAHGGEFSKLRFMKVN